MDPDEFIRKWNTYLNGLETLCKAKFNRKPNTPYTKHLVPLVEDVIKDLRQAEEDVKKAVLSELDSEDNGNAIEYLDREFDFFNAQVKSLPMSHNGELLASDDVDDAIGAGKTIKDSFEKLLRKLPEKWKRRLKILNELLSLVKGG